ncbi:hypothetical protein F8271_28555 [Micromonospora sp. ALFpr18c]|uniref:hypothetical protein n=1 Tax=unclassified Micromonospora TaxID=2617518 RepID=UPI00124AEFF4|nr:MULTISPECIES: hypothetical protein [unclassified Micromonospora]KAB1929829.1 hypothetical protein F8271_28555 [Micromonospora sp. ALFpr18c]MDG4762170.1 hypothetical protein [Micromonospora sp. WMMD710]
MKIFTYERLAAMPSVHAPLSAVRVALAAARPSVPQVHQVQAELTLAVAPTGVDGTSGITGMGIDGAKKRTNVRGVPPRGRPV